MKNGRINKKTSTNDRYYWVNTPVSQDLFKKTKTRAHQLELTRADYIRTLIKKDLKSAERKKKKSNRK